MPLAAPCSPLSGLLCLGSKFLKLTRRYPTVNWGYPSRIYQARGIREQLAVNL